MEEQHRGVALVILGIIAIIAVIGLVLMFSGARKSVGAVPTLLGTTLPGGFCDSPCTAGFGASDAEAWNQVIRFVEERGFVPIGPTQVQYSVDGFELHTICVCPPMDVTPFAPTGEEAQVVYGTPYAPRVPGVASPMQVQVPAGAGYDVGSVPAYPYPASINK